MIIKHRSNRLAAAGLVFVFLAAGTSTAQAGRAQQCANFARAEAAGYEGRVPDVALGAGAGIVGGALIASATSGVSVAVGALIGGGAGAAFGYHHGSVYGYHYRSAYYRCMRGQN